MSKKLIENQTLGADPEFFLKSKETGKYVPSFYYISGSKYEPTPIGEEGHNIQCDNVMVEVGIPPCKTVEEWIKHNLFVQNYIKENVCEPNNLELVIFPFAEFDTNDLKSRQAKAFGCDPDFCVYKNGEANTVGKSTIKNGRCAGGHIHIGYDDWTPETNDLIIRAMDLFLSVPLMIFEPEHKRKEMYGKAGAYRMQPWGTEYRVTSNYIFSSIELMTWAFNQTQKALEFINDNHTNLPEIMKGNKLESIINNKDVKACEKLIKEFKIEMFSSNLVLIE